MLAAGSKAEVDSPVVYLALLMPPRAVRASEHATVAEHRKTVTLVVPVVLLVLPVTVPFALFPGLISIVSLAQ